MGKCEKMKRTVIYIHGKGGSAEEAEHYCSLFPETRVVGFDYCSQTPWEAREEFPAFLDAQKQETDEILLIANSIGAFFSMNGLHDPQIKRAFFISPIVNMEQLILDMMKWAGVTEEKLRERKTIETSFGEILSWEYLSWVREHPISWDVPTSILYGGGDTLQSMGTIKSFVEKIGADLTVMENGEHWFHTEEQMAFLDQWLLSLKRVIF